MKFVLDRAVSSTSNELSGSLFPSFWSVTFSEQPGAGLSSSTSATDVAANQADADQSRRRISFDPALGLDPNAHAQEMAPAADAFKPAPSAPEVCPPSILFAEAP
jgi:hypothetical protein